MRSLFYIVMLLAITACSYSGKHTRTLDEAQHLMLSDPSAALSKLNNLDISEFQDSATMARWAILYTEAMVANKLSAPTDTIINIAIEYYGSHSLSDELRKAARLKALLRASDNTDALATALYLQKEKEFFLYKEHARREQIMFISLICIITAFSIILWMRQRLRMQSLQNEKLMAEASDLKKQIDAGRDDLGRLKIKMHSLLENRFALIDSLCQTYYQSQGTKTERKAIIDKVRKEIESARSDAFPKMEEAVNDCRDHILEKIKTIYPDIKPGDYQLLVYLACGLSTRTICLLLDESVDVIYKRKSRLKSRLREMASPSFPDIMSIF